MHVFPVTNAKLLYISLPSQWKLLLPWLEYHFSHILPNSCQPRINFSNFILLLKCQNLNLIDWPISHKCQFLSSHWLANSMQMPKSHFHWWKLEHHKPSTGTPHLHREFNFLISYIHCFLLFSFASLNLKLCLPSFLLHNNCICQLIYVLQCLLLSPPPWWYLDSSAPPWFILNDSFFVSLIQTHTLFPAQLIL